MADRVIITCLGDSAFIGDLGLLLHRGDAGSASAHEARISKDLQAARDMGLVSVKEDRMMPPRVPEETRPTHGSASALAISRSSVRPDMPGAHPPPAPHDATGQMTLMVLREILAEVKGLRAEMAKRPVAAPDMALLGALQHMMTVPTGRPSTSSAGPILEADPQFIPSDLTRAMGDGRVEVQTTETGSDGSLDDAAAFLRARKRGATKT